MPKKIWIADDDPGIQELLILILKGQDYDVRMFGSGQQMLEETNGLPDLFILDGLMRGMHGLELCAQLKNNERTSHIPVIMLSALNDIKDKAAACGADSAIEKPFQLEDLLDEIEKQINKN